MASHRERIKGDDKSSTCYLKLPCRCQTFPGTLMFSCRGLSDVPSPDSLGLAPVQPRPAVWTRVGSHADAGRLPAPAQDVPLHTLAAPWEVLGADVLGPVTRRPSHGPWHHGRLQPSLSLWLSQQSGPLAPRTSLSRIFSSPQRTPDTEVFPRPLRVSDTLPGGPGDTVSPRP